MKLNLRSKLLISYIIVILCTLVLLSWFVDIQISQHFRKFYEEGIEMRIGPKGDIFLEAIRQSIFLTVLVGGFIAIFISFIISGYIVKPIKKLIEATKAIALGKYEERVKIESDDELGDLTMSLNSMATSLEDHRYLQQQLITNVSHELATPLTNIGGYLEALNDGVIEEKNRKETYILMKEETDRLKTMLDEVRTLSILEQTSFKIHPAPVNIKILSQKIIKQILPQFKEKGVPIKVESSLKSEEFTLDKDRYTQILLNILNNALQYSGKGKQVTVELSESAAQVKITIEDHGIGIPAKELPYIFERFYRTDKSRNRKTGGLGVGLAIVKELVEAHGGKISARSEEGKGSTFTILFPKL